jgi:hypothetical protein
MKILFLIPVLFLAGSLVACNETKPLVNKQTNNPEINVSVLFEIDGCKVYRFYDDGRNRYFTNCDGRTISEHTENCGRNCTKTLSDDIETRNLK